MLTLYINWNIDPEIFRLGGFALRYYSLLFALAFLLGYWLMKKMFVRESMPEELLQPLLIYIVVATVIGARLGQTLFYEFDYYKNHPLEIVLPFRVINGSFEWTGYQGLASHGGAIGILAALALFARRYKIPFLWIADRLVIAVALGGFFIRLANLFNSEIIGKPTSAPWAFIFERIDPFPRHPAQLYEALAYLLIFAFLFISYRKSRGQRRGYLLGLFLIFIFLTRFAIEFTKEAQEAFEKAWLLNMGQILSIPFVLLGFYLVFQAAPAEKSQIH
ncbi:prolipoprotein diacylglyceryl transferase [Cnuella takakiae]|uniref:Phosphatidylglycerol--prolipoprotein diacylglyceryl transferase n=1 Tax=Cnuella takakiae TaxID=1302690 RepID=A0A1M4SNH5_9BACT|nr:prolipoprotein diacylglyceryl transferase [Cnuella takakiae]SHE33712.1 prolipoprotein diacylglyceryl transferase [Cnuella takakiae]